jgi:hypothetical protein
VSENSGTEKHCLELWKWSLPSSRIKSGLENFGGNMEEGKEKRVYAESRKPLLFLGG